VRIDILIPAYNEERRINRTLDVYRSACPGPDIRFLVALDGSSDGTAEMVARHQMVDARVRMFDYPKLGKGGVLMETFRRTDAEFVAFVDADCATPPAELLRLLDAAREADGAIASRRHPTAVLPSRRSWPRRIASAGFAFGVRALFRLPYSDTQCGAKVLRREAVERCLPFLSSRDFLFDVDLLIVARRLGFRVVEVPTIWIDQDGSKLKTSSDARRMAASALRLWLHHRVLPVHQSPLRRESTSVVDLSQERTRVPA
jgi:glycosyltransferase involved in cell wall biosynthesis